MSQDRVGMGKGPECVSSDHGERQVGISQHIFLNIKGRKTSIGMAWQQMVSGISLENLFGIERRVEEMLATRVILTPTCWTACIF